MTKAFRRIASQGLGRKEAEGIASFQGRGLTKQCEQLLLLRSRGRCGTEDKEIQWSEWETAI